MQASHTPSPPFPDTLTADRPRLLRLWRDLRARQHRGADARAACQTKFDALLERSRKAFADRHAALPTPTFPPELPVSARRDEIIRALTGHQVIIVCGETGSGKTTQLPKICLSLGRGVGGMIGHTQPRRLAARATATRIAQELNSPPGEVVGYKIRFTDHVSKLSYIKLMTDGILLAETQGDPLLSAYDTIIIDEAHERSLNVDFLLGYLKTLLPQRPDLKVIVTSATLDAERFARHFSAPDGKPAPVIEVSGRLFPIETRWRPVTENENEDDFERNERNRAAGRHKDLFEALTDAVDEAQRCGPGDILVFLPGEREIREASQALARTRLMPGSEVLPLFARQSAAEQARVFSPSNGRRIVLATNVAETSLTVPGVRYVVDSGLARVKRYSTRNKVEQLQIEPISRAAAAQRAGRCGRVMDGICFRLYDEDDFNRRPPHTDPEILRSSLAGVILRMKALKLGAVEDFPFLDAPGTRLIGDGYALLAELGAIDDAIDEASRKLTPIGVALSKLPLDPRVGRMLLAAHERGALAEVLVIAAALSAQDPRERPQDSPGTADQAHAKFRGAETDRQSEFLWYWNVWKAFAEVQRHESGNQQKQWCRRHFLSNLRMREWRDVYAQLHTLCVEHGWRVNEIPARFDAIHQSLLTGLLGNIGCRAEEASGTQAGSYLGTRGIRFWPHPGSMLAKKAGKWIMAAEQVETSRLFGRCIARIEPEWVEEVGEHLIRRQRFEPHWSKNAGSVQAWERGVLYGLTIWPRRSVSYREIDPALCRELFIREGLVGGEIADGPAKAMRFLAHNQKLVAEIERLEHKTRRPDVLVDETLIEAFYDSKIPADVVDLASFERWRKTAEKSAPKLLHLTREQLMRHEAEGVTSERFPPSLEVLGKALKLDYRHTPGEPDDGVSLTVPLAMLNQIPATRCEWLVPGLLEEKVIALLKTVPQKIRHRLQPLQESAEDFIRAGEAGEIHGWRDGPLLDALQGFIEERARLKLAQESFRPENLPPHCFMNYQIIDEHGRVLGKSRQLSALRARFKEAVAAKFDKAHVTVSKKEPAETGANSKTIQSGLYGWCFGTLPERLEVRVDGREVIGFPALHDDGNSVSLRPFDTPEEAAKTHRRGLTRLFAIALKDQVKAIERLPGLRELALQYRDFGNESELKTRLVEATLAHSCLADPLPADADTFAARCQRARSRAPLLAQEFIRLTAQLVTESGPIKKRLGTLAKAFPEATADIRSQLDQLLPNNFLVAFAWDRLQHFPRYLKAISVRLDKLREDPSRDTRLMAEWQPLHQLWKREHLAHVRADINDPALEDFRWLLEELRVSLWAQPLKTPMPVSVKRLWKVWEGRGYQNS